LQTNKQTNKQTNTEKNKYTLQPDLIALCQSSKNPFVASLLVDKEGGIVFVCVCVFFFFKKCRNYM